MKVKKVKEFMSRNIVKIGRSTPLRQIARVFMEEKADFLLVVDKEERLVGVITQKDILTPFIPEYFDFLDDIDFISDFGSLEDSLPEALENLILAEDIMVKEIITVGEDASLFKALALIYKHKVRHLPVVKEGKIVGIVTPADIIRALFGEESSSK